MEEGKRRSSLKLQEEIRRPSLTSTESDQPKHPLTVRLPRDTFRLIEFEAERTGVSMAEVVRRYVHRTVERGDW